MHQLAQKLITAGRPARSAEFSAAPSVVSANSGIGSPTSGEGSRSITAKACEQDQASGMARTGMTSQRAAHRSAVNRVHGRCSQATLRPDGEGRSEDHHRPPTQIQATNGLMNRRSVISPLSGS